MINSLCENILKNFDSGAITTIDGDVIYMKYETLADIGTFSTATRVAHQYIKLKTGDIAILNDPYSGGTLLSTMSLITPLCLNDSNYPDLLLCVHVGFKPNLLLAKSLEEEGVRIPPTPIVQNGETNQIILDAIASHPLCPNTFKAKILDHINMLQSICKRYQNLVKLKASPISKSELKNYLDKSKKRFEQELADLPETDVSFELELDQGETIKTHITIENKKIKIDFRGSSPSKITCLTDGATFGACFGAIEAFFENKIMINSAAFSLVDVISPVGCLLNSKYPMPTFKGMTDGVSLVASSVLSALNSLLPSAKCAQGAITTAKVQFDFGNGLKYYDNLPGGSGACKNIDGTDAAHLWIRNNLEPSIEEIEKLYPLKIRQVSIRNNSGGKGEKTGGNGMVAEYEPLAAAKMHWILDQTKIGALGANGGAKALPSEISIKRKSEKKFSVLENHGHLDVSPNDFILLSSSGGGGWGKV